MKCYPSKTESLSPCPSLDVWILVIVIPIRFFNKRCYTYSLSWCVVPVSIDWRRYNSIDWCNRHTTMALPIDPQSEWHYFLEKERHYILFHVTSLGFLGLDHLSNGLCNMMHSNLSGYNMFQWRDVEFDSLGCIKGLFHPLTDISINKLYLSSKSNHLLLPLILTYSIRSPQSIPSITSWSS